VTDVARTFEPLDVTADLQVTVDGREYAVTGHGERITVGASSFPDAIALARRSGSNRPASPTRCCGDRERDA
jgi:hypothetical protein